jgi:hypothetical protein
MEHNHENITNPKLITFGKYRNLYKANSGKEKAKMELFSEDSVRELNTTKLENSPSFLTITHTTPFAKRFRSYGILTTDVDAEFYFWTEQWENGS